MSAQIDRTAHDEGEQNSDSDNEAKDQEDDAQNENEENSSVNAPEAASSIPNGYHQVTEDGKFITVEDGQCVTVRIPIFFCIIVPMFTILLGIIAIFIVLIALGPQADMELHMLTAQEQFGKDVVNVFKGHDLNQDHHLSFAEFKELLPHMKDIKSLASKVTPVEKYPEYTAKEGEEVLIIHANFSPLRMKPILSMSDFLSFDVGSLVSKFVQLYLRIARFYFMPLFTGQWTLHGLETWTEPNRQHEVFGVSEFKALLPDDVEAPEVGLPYHVLRYSGVTETGDHDPNPHAKRNSRKYVPRLPQNCRERVLYRLLAMMHPRPFLNMRFHPRGTVACVRAVNDQYVHVVFRMHAEFQLSQVPANPFWFSPAQFVGDLVVRRDGSHVHYFHLEVPSERKLNVDMEWMLDAVEGFEGMEVDIGYMPLMRWTMGGDSHLPLPDQSVRPDLSLTQSPDNITWKEELPREGVLKLLEEEFFEFTKVRYHNLTHAARLAKEQDKPLHAIFLWGALDDQSC